MTAKQQSELANGNDIDGMTPEDESDSVGSHKDCDVMLQRFRKAGDPKLYGFLYASSYLAGDLFDYLGNDAEEFEVEAYEHTETRYRRADGAPFQK